MAYRAQREDKLDALQPPQSLDAEQAVLGAILKDVEALQEVLEIIQLESVFYSPKHQLIYSAILGLFDRSEPVDITTVANALLKDGNLERIGGRLYLLQLVENVASTAHAKSYAEIILEKSLLRRLIDTSNEIVRSCYALEKPIGDLLDQAEANIFLLSQRRLHQGFTPLGELIPSTFEQIEDLQSPDSTLVGVKSGFAGIDEMTNGMHRGQFIVIAGRPSMGKTALALNIAEQIAVNNNIGVGVFSVEMSKEQLALRLLCSRAGVSEQKLRSRKIRKEEWTRLSTRGGVLARAPIFIDDSPSLTPLEMRAKARRLRSQHNVGLIVIDYIQLMGAAGRFENRQQEIAHISRSMKALAKELDIPVIACSQLSRQVEQRGGDKKPQLSDLRESGAIEQDADVVMFIYRAEHYLAAEDRESERFKAVEGKAEVIIAKQRNGPTGVVHLAFLKEFARFENLAYHPAELPHDAEPVGGGDVPF